MAAVAIGAMAQTFKESVGGEAGNEVISEANNDAHSEKEDDMRGGVKADDKVRPRPHGHAALSIQQKAMLCRHKEENPRFTCNQLCDWAMTSFKLSKRPSQQAMSDVLKRKDYWKERSDNATPYNMAKKRESSTPVAALEEELLKWYKAQETAEICLTDSNIQQRAKQIALQKPELKVQAEFKFSSKWLLNFKRRCAISTARTRKESTGACHKPDMPHAPCRVDMPHAPCRVDMPQAESMVVGGIPMVGGDGRVIVCTQALPYEGPPQQPTLAQARRAAEELIQYVHAEKDLKGYQEGLERLLHQLNNQAAGQ